MLYCLKAHTFGVPKEYTGICFIANSEFRRTDVYNLCYLILCWSHEMYYPRQRGGEDSNYSKKNRMDRL